MHTAALLLNKFFKKKKEGEKRKKERKKKKKLEWKAELQCWVKTHRHTHIPGGAVAWKSHLCASKAGGHTGRINVEINPGPSTYQRGDKLMKSNSYVLFWPNRHLW